MWGYRGNWEWAGKCAARADDVLSYLPARLTAALIAVSAWAWKSALGRVEPLADATAGLSATDSSRPRLPVADALMPPLHTKKADVRSGPIVL
jgi:cobalamin biosynthesis protein CobD/CbiB